MSTEALAHWAVSAIGVDVSADMLEESVGPRRARYVRAEAESLPFADESFNLATAALAIHWFDDEAIEQIGRVLKAASSLVVYDVRFPAEMVGEDGFGDHMAAACTPRYPRV
jgi:ubiquinone/menaquinone biosynthesis C-methylase UbiE